MLSTWASMGGTLPAKVLCHHPAWSLLGRNWDQIYFYFLSANYFYFVNALIAMISTYPQRQYHLRCAKNEPSPMYQSLQADLGYNCQMKVNTLFMSVTYPNAPRKIGRKIHFTTELTYSRRQKFSSWESIWKLNIKFNVYLRKVQKINWYTKTCLNSSRNCESIWKLKIMYWKLNLKCVFAERNWDT